MARLFLLVLVLAAGYVIIQTLPDIQRYLKIRSM